MIIFGTRYVKRAKQPTQLTTTSAEGVREVLAEVYPYLQYFHVFFIPLFPISRLVGIPDGDGVRVLESKKLQDANLREQIETLRSANRLPVWSFSGMFVFLGLVLLGSYTSGEHEKEKLAVAAAPQLGDIYFANVGNLESSIDTFTTYKVVGLDSNMVYMVSNEHMLTGASYLSSKAKTRLLTETTFDLEDTIIVPKASIEAMFAEKRFVDFERTQ